MVASFMPSLAFAAVATDADKGKEHQGHYYAVDIDASTVAWNDVQKAVEETSKVKDYVEVVKAPAHGVAGKAKLTCMSYGCDKTIEVTIGALTHETNPGNLIDKDFTLEEFAAKLVEQKYDDANFKTEEAAANWVKTQRAGGACYRACKVCPCGEIISSVSKTHKNDSCGDVTCPQCGETIKGTGKHKFDKDVSAVEIPANCGHGVGHEATCSVCGVRGVKYATPDTPSTTAAHNYGTPVAFKDATVKEKNAAGTAYVYKVKAGYVAVSNSSLEFNLVGTVLAPGEEVELNTEDYDFFKSNKVVTAPTCKGTGVDTLACTVCGEVLKDKTPTSDNVADVRITTPKAGHDYAETEVAATCDSNAYTLKKCTVCKHEEKAYKPNTQLAHNYVVTKTSADCKGGEVYTIECTTCKDCAHTSVDRTKANFGPTDLYAEDTDTVTYLWKGFDGELSTKDAIQLTYSKKAVGHKYGKKELLRAATCTSNEVWGYKCTECGKLAVHEAGHAIEYKLNTKAAHDFVKTEVAATCGTAGYSYEQCSVCKVYKKGTTTDASLETAGVKTTIAPVVKTGAACSFDKWVVTKNATVFEKGVESLVCSVCGADGHENEAIAKLKYAAPAVKAGKKSATVTVKATAGAVSYKISYKKAGGSYKTIDAKAGKKTIKKLAKGKKYTFKAIAVNAEGVEVASATKTVKVK